MTEQRLRPWLSNPEEWEAAKLAMETYRDRDPVAIAGQAWRAGFRGYQIAHFMGIHLRTAQKWARRARHQFDTPPDA